MLDIQVLCVFVSLNSFALFLWFCFLSLLCIFLRLLSKASGILRSGRGADRRLKPTLLDNDSGHRPCLPQKKSFLVEDFRQIRGSVQPPPTSHVAQYFFYFFLDGRRSRSSYLRRGYSDTHLLGLQFDRPPSHRATRNWPSPIPKPNPGSISPPKTNLPCDRTGRGGIINKYKNKKNTGQPKKMADPLLSTLCSICHAAPPKYVCPGCAAATCSLPCSQRHKTWSSCSGQRDPTAYMPSSKLKTAAGIDHDYNFLSAIERERDRNQRELVEDRGMFTEKQLREMDEPRKWRRMWFGEEVHFVNKDGERRGGQRGRGAAGAIFGSDGEGDGDEDRDKDSSDKASTLVRKVRNLLEQEDIEVVHMPVGMTRSRENKTAWNRRTWRINWSVEWFLHDDLAPGGAPATRIRYKTLDTVPLYRAFARSLAWYRSGRHNKQKHHSSSSSSSSASDSEEDIQLSAYARKRRYALIKEVKEANRRTAAQDADTGAWLATPYATQNPYTGGWEVDRAAAVSSWLPHEELEAWRHHRFFLLRPLTPAGKPRQLIPVRSDQALARALTGRTVLEFPTVYVLPPAGEGEEDKLPEGCVLGSTERRKRQRKPKNKPEKRKSDAKPNNPTKRQALDGDQCEAEAGRPMRAGSRQQQQRGRGRGRGGLRGRGSRGGGRSQPQQQRQQQRRVDSDAEEGEINSDGEEVVGFPSTARRAAERADTSSSDPDASSDEEIVVDDDDNGKDDAMDVDVSAHGLFDMIKATKIATPPDSASAPAPAAAAAAANKKTTGLGMGLVDYGSDSSDDDDENDEDEDADLAGLRPENPELVANAIQEIVGLLT